MLPAQRSTSRDPRGWDPRAVLALAVSLMGSSALQTVLDLTDTCSVGHVSSQAVAAVGAVHWPIAVLSVVLGSIAAVVQTTGQSSVRCGVICAGQSDGLDCSMRDVVVGALLS